ncbi:MAG: hypothetical protein IT204_22705 [Fimbriimonadaceae bacterium]|nr:hypothetical protein [Fimbriimonadaceae bacterium]
MVPQAALTLCLCAVGQPGAAIPLELSPTVVHAASVRQTGDVTTVQCTGDDPYVLCREVTAPYDSAALYLVSFEYRSPQPQDFELYFIAPGLGWTAARPPQQPATADWRAVVVDLRTARQDGWRPGVQQFRLDCSGGQYALEVRRLVLRGPTAAEQAAARDAAAAAERERLAQVAAVERTLIAPRRLGEVGDSLGGSLRYADADGTLAVAVVGRQTDLVSQLAAHPEVRPSAPLAPALVVGEGPHPDNHSVVRILDQHGLAVAQVLAFDPDLRGGVRVAAWPDGRLAVTPALAPGGQVAVFSRWGLPLQRFQAPAELGGPLLLAAGPQLALAPAQAAGEVVPFSLHDSTGQRVGGGQISLPGPAPRRVLLAWDGPRLLLGVAGGPLVAWTPAGQTPPLATLPGNALAVSASGDPVRPFTVTLADGEVSQIARLGAAAPVLVEVGQRERLFWQTWHDVPETTYVRHAEFAHLRVDFASPAARQPDFTRRDAAFWAGEQFKGYLDSTVGRYDQRAPTCWEPCFTHRWFYDQAKAWREANDPETGLPAYVLVDRDNNQGTYGEFGETKSFVSGSYAPDVAPVEDFYTLPLRAFLHRLVQAHRRNPEHFVAVEPNHEMEINAESETTHGDYNPNMLRAFCRYVATLYGGLEGINRTFGTAFTPDRFDAPRNLGRGPWDRYAVENRYYLVWMRFLNQVIYQVVAGTYREALLAGFPPEAVRCHQIPDHYAIASLTQFSRPAQRITPIDWNLNAGVGYGFTKYGVWYDQPHNVVQGGWSSGFDQMLIGEYHSLTPDPAPALAQLRYLRDHGVSFIHCMTWPAGHDRGYNAALRSALQQLAADNQPRPGVTGGTGELRRATVGGRPVELVSVGVGERTGLLKSIAADGSWEGSVYVVPFHSQVAVAPGRREARLELTAAGTRLGAWDGLDAGNLLEVTALAAGPAGGELTLRVCHGEVELPGCRLRLPLTAAPRPVRLLVRVQLETDRLVLELAGPATLTDLTVVHHREQTTKLKRGILAGTRHRGGVSFDVIPEEAVR